MKEWEIKREGIAKEEDGNKRFFRMHPYYLYRTVWNRELGRRGRGVLAESFQSSSIFVSSRYFYNFSYNMTFSYIVIHKLYLCHLTYICLHIYIYIHSNMSTYIHTYMHTYLHTYVPTYIGVEIRFGVEYSFCSTDETRSIGVFVKEILKHLYSYILFSVADDLGLVFLRDEIFSDPFLYILIQGVRVR
jgi:hypothetical protein